MGRKHRSSSFGNVVTPKSASLASPSLNAAQNALDIEACNTLLNLFLHSKNSDGQTFLHQAVQVVSSNKNADDKLDGLFLLDSLVNRAKELDIACASASKGKGSVSNARAKLGFRASSTNHNLRHMMLTKDDESGYTPIHHAILRRDLQSILLLLKHASSHVDNNNAHSSNDTNTHQIHHPLRLLDGNLGDNDNFSIMNELAATADNEKLTPLQLLGVTSISDLEICRNTLQWKNLKKTWKEELSCVQQPDYDDVPTNANPRRYRQRMISFGDERDHDALNYEIEQVPDDSRERRMRSGSFNNVPRGYHSDDDEQNSDVMVDNDIFPLGNVDFTTLQGNGSGNVSVEEGDGGDDRTVDELSRLRRLRSNSAVDIHPGSSDHGCEVLTFGRADHCALGVPQFATAGRRERRGEESFFGGGKGGSTVVNDVSVSSSYKPKRVEAFALGEMRRGWTTSNVFSSTEEAVVDSPAVAVAASAHHTLVATRSGRLFSFGLGKGGRLGTGDENHRPLPTRIMGPLTRRIVASIAAAENHSLCSTADGSVFAWGSNGFGQLGMSSNQDQNSSKLSPRRVESMKQCFVVAVAAGERHSVALTKLGEVYAWGDNKSAQLGTRSLLSSNRDSISSSASSPGAGSSVCHRPQRVEGLWSAKPRRRAISVAAAEFSTLVLTMPPTFSDGESSLASLPVNVIYGWGHGNHVPMRVTFPTAGGSNSSTDLSRTSTSSYTRSICINPTAIACAKYHNIACTADGRIYTWGLHSESLGIEKCNTQKNDDSDWATPSNCKNPLQSSTIGSPRLVVAMLPENGGGRAVSVSASESHSAVVTADGHLFTWGSCYGNDALGHKGVRWQPSPRKVKRVHRAVGVSSAKEHTALLIGTSFPALPCLQPVSENVVLPGAKLSANADHHSPLSLQDLGAIEIARNVDLFNVVPVAIVARRLNCHPLINFCEKFIQMNMDGVLSVGKLGDFEMFISSRTGLEVTERSYQYDGIFHPLLYQLANAKDWMKDGRWILKSCSGSIKPMNVKRSGNSESTARQRKGKDIIVVAENVADKEPSVQSETSDPIVDAKPNAEKEVQISEDNTEVLHVSRKLFREQEVSRRTSVPCNASKYRCDACGVSCPDNDSYTLHMNGRKHRNRLNHVKAEEEKNVAESMMAMKRVQLTENKGNDVYFQNQMMKGKTIPTFPTHQSNKLLPKEAATHAKSAWVSPAVTSLNTDTMSKNKMRSNSFQEILKEEKQRTAITAQPRIVPPKFQSAAKVVNPQSRIVSTANTPTSSTYSAKSPSIASKKSLPLSAFLERKTEQKQNKIVGGWAAKPASSNVPAKPTQPKGASLFDIQKEEEDMKSKEDHMSRIGGNKWYVHQRERAASIGEIQDKQKKDEEWHQFVEEQKKIEEEISRENQEKLKQDSAKKRRKKQGRKKPGTESGKVSNLKAKSGSGSVKIASKER